MTQKMALPRTFSQRFISLFCMGLVGIALLPVVSMPLLRSQWEMLPPSRPPLGVIVAASVLQPLILLAVATAFGAAFAHRVNLRSLVAEGRSLKLVFATLPIALVTGTGLGLLFSLLDWQVFQPQMPEFFEAANRLQPRTWSTMLLGLLYGGITEEILLRWGAISLLVWLGWRGFQRRRAEPSKPVFQVAIAIAAIAFALAHLPAVAAFAPLSPLLALRVLLLNGLGGLIFGWLFWRHNLETAMVSHGSVHVVVTLISTLLPFLPKT
ncbi:type II CAAX prenyl endopeptidase Rce1 family protein [Geitlerinema sp. PCC 7407]|uniref:CPBP family glutamic-type intramembrane protease n=1 Tax=Geitlerinema sp. PCC 7407 TaxID=1173025 RepID=UPI00029FBCEB|nr:CPBP family glutamic-type intramembrane protease [Geitlerinema sp. PCC 7407]AFY67008.1 hypothetical protein GEI7407_2533 [Geitlerinema sp. PCC 7407]